MCVTYGQETIKMVLGNTECQLYTCSLLLLLRQGAGRPLVCLISVICIVQGILIWPSIRHAGALQGTMPINSSMEYH